VAANKLVAKVASDRDKPGGLTVVRPGQEASFLAPLPVRVLWGVGPVTADRLAEMGVMTVGDLARMTEEALRACFGRHGSSMARRALGIDNRAVVTEHEVKSVSQELTFTRDLRDLHALKVQLWKLSQGVARRLERCESAAGCVALKLRYDNFETLSRQMRLAVPTAEELEIYRSSLVLLERAWEPGRPVRLLGVAARQLTEPTGQLPLWDGV
jgi:DNA polymerase-4